MFDIGWSELLLIGIVALIVIGPKDLPGMFRTLGRFTAKARSMGREFQRAMDDAARESGVADTAKDLKAMTSKKSLGLDALDQAASKFEKWQPTKASTTPKGPATQALADKKAAEAAARTAAKSTTTPATSPTAVAEPSATTKVVAAKPKAPPKAPKSPAKTAAAKAATPAASKKPSPRATKGDA